MESTEPTVIVVLTPKGLEKAFVLYEEDDVDALEAGNLLLARISAQLALLDNALRMGEDKSKGI
jgi:hypothetical protein